MELDDVGEVIAERRLSLVSNLGREIVVKMGKPQPFPGAPYGDFFCPIQITGLGSEKVKRAGGVDAFQAIELALKLIAIELEALNREHDGQLRWECDDDGDLGFPSFEGWRRFDS